MTNSDYYFVRYGATSECIENIFLSIFKKPASGTVLASMMD